MERKACVIGAGIGGIATALRLNKDGWKVTVFESSAEPGGKIKQIQKDNYRFDTGPSLFTLPALVDELFELYNENPRHYFDYKKLENVTRYFYPDGTTINARQNPQEFADEIENKTGEPASNVLTYLKHAEKLYQLTANTFIFRPFTLNQIFTRDFLRAGLNFRKLNALKTMHQVNELYFSDPRVIQLFDRYATYNGSDPFQTPGTLSVISHLEHNIGAFFPKHGMHEIVQSLFEFSKQNNIRFSFQDPVNEIILKDNLAKGVKASSGDYYFDAVVTNADVFQTYGRLLSKKKIPSKILKQERSSSALIFYWGINDTHEHLDVHNILFSNNYKEEFNQMFTHKNIYEDPTVYIFISSKAVETDAPAGKENWFVMINAPANKGQQWDTLINEARKNIITKINRMLKTDIESKIELEEILDPRKIEEQTHSFQGALYGNSSNSMFSAFQRHGNTAAIKNLYFTGGSVHPGGGIPLCLASASITANEIKKHHQ